MIKSIYILVITLALSLNTTAFANKANERAIPKGQNIKVKAISLIGGNQHSEKKLENILLEEASKGWTYDYHVDIDSNGYLNKLFVFKRAKINK